MHARPAVPWGSAFFPANLVGAQEAGDAVPGIDPAPYGSEQRAPQDKQRPGGAHDQSRRDVVELLVRTEPARGDGEQQDEDGQHACDGLSQRRRRLPGLEGVTVRPHGALRGSRPQDRHGDHDEKGVPAMLRKIAAVFVFALVVGLTPLGAARADHTDPNTPLSPTEGATESEFIATGEGTWGLHPQFPGEPRYRPRILHAGH